MVQLFEGHAQESNVNNIKKLMKGEYYDGKLHSDYIILLKIFIAFFVPLIALGYLHSKSVINDKVYFRISILIFFLMFIIASGKIIDIYWRNKMDYDKYDRIYNVPNTVTSKEKKTEKKQGTQLIDDNKD
tara:strand:- start:8327 stop:8716 length:390 start_codon:yes stop_codon:yes gene_type:complete